jgi:hypothetical protein
MDKIGNPRQTITTIPQTICHVTHKRPIQRRSCVRNYKFSYYYKSILPAADWQPLTHTEAKLQVTLMNSYLFAAFIELLPDVDKTAGKWGMGKLAI